MDVFPIYLLGDEDQSCRYKGVQVSQFIFLIETRCCDHSSEPSQRDGSDEESQHIVLCRINKNDP